MGIKPMAELRRGEAKKRLKEECPCRRGTQPSLRYHDCCAPYHHEAKRAASAEELMRSRYSAFVYQELDYLLASWHPSTRPALLEADHETRWRQLIIREHYVSKKAPEREAYVLFEARFFQGGEAHRMVERSRFVKQDQRWFYIDGELEWR